MELIKVDEKNLWKIVNLKVNEEQLDFVATNTQSILQAYVAITSEKVALPFGIYEEDKPIGFVMIGYGRTDEDDPDIAEGNYCIWRFMIDKEYQNRGYGKKALQLTLDYIRQFPCGSAEYCWLDYEKENEAAAKLYKSFGFKEYGELDEGEIAAVLKL